VSPRLLLLGSGSLLERRLTLVLAVPVWEEGGMEGG